MPSTISALLIALAAAAGGSAAGPGPSPPPDGARPVLAGAATPVNPKLCRALGPDAWRCAGIGGIDVFLHGPPERRTVSLGDPRPALPPLPFEAASGGSLRWRLGADGPPLAAILRYRRPDGEVFDLVLRVPRRDGRPGCLAAIVTGASPTAAQDRADRSAAGFRCGVDAATVEGPASPMLAAGMRRLAREADALARQPAP